MHVGNHMLTSALLQAWHEAGDGRVAWPRQLPCLVTVGLGGSVGVVMVLQLALLPLLV